MASNSAKEPSPYRNSMKEKSNRLPSRFLLDYLPLPSFSGDLTMEMFKRLPTPLLLRTLGKRLKVPCAVFPRQVRARGLASGSQGV